MTELPDLASLVSNIRYRYLFNFVAMYWYIVCIFNKCAHKALAIFTPNFFKSFPSNLGYKGDHWKYNNMVKYALTYVRRVGGVDRVDAGNPPAFPTKADVLHSDMIEARLKFVPLAHPGVRAETADLQVAECLAQVHLHVPSSIRKEDLFRILHSK